VAASGEDGSGTYSPQGDGHGREEGSGHVPVLLQEAIDFLTIRRGGTYIDATLGGCGHSLAIARRLGRQGHLISFDKDPAALALGRERLVQAPAGREGDWPRITLIHASYADLTQHVGRGEADGLIADLGISSRQLAEAGRGFSLQAEGPLDMRMDPRSERTADQVVNHMRESDLADVIYEFGEERRSRRIARAIVRARPIRSTKHLAQVVSAAAPTMKPGRIHPATRTFQAIRIFVNRELDDLRAMIAGKTAGAPLVLKSGGRLVIVSFHSLEDRIVKDALRDGAREGHWRLLTKKPVTPTEEEVESNPRARSARLRAAEKV
jgi:16S rRNA (cytosine1402-N4)-methyltransferase